MEMLVRQDFEPHINQPFTILSYRGDIKAQLIEVTPLGGPFRSGAREPFSLLFEAAPGSSMLNQGLYSVSNSSLGEKTLFLVPVGEKGTCYHYEAVFN